MRSALYKAFAFRILRIRCSIRSRDSDAKFSHIIRRPSLSRNLRRHVLSERGAPLPVARLDQKGCGNFLSVHSFCGLREEAHHARGVAGVVKRGQFLVERLRVAVQDADGAIAVPHQMAVHHQGRRSLVGVVEKLRAGHEEKRRDRAFPGFQAPLDEREAPLRYLRQQRMVRRRVSDPPIAMSEFLNAPQVRASSLPTRP